MAVIYKKASAIYKNTLYRLFGSGVVSCIFSCLPSGNPVDYLSQKAHSVLLSGRLYALQRLASVFARLRSSDQRKSI